MLTGTALHKQFASAERPALDGVDIEVRAGTITTVLGSNGCGKSTLLGALALLDPIDSGSITMDGAPYRASVRGLPDPSPWPTVTIVFQRLFLWPHLTVRQNVNLPWAARARDANERFSEMVSRFDLGGLEDRYPNEISIGQQQRVALARAVALKPKYLLLDEATSALDVKHVTSLLGLLKELRSEGVGILLVTHMIGFAREAADHVVFMADGRIVEQGGADILAAPDTPELSRFLAVLEPSVAVPRSVVDGEMAS